MNLFLKRLYSSVPSQYISSSVMVKMVEAEEGYKGMLYELYAIGFQRGFIAGGKEAEDRFVRHVGMN